MKPKAITEPHKTAEWEWKEMHLTQIEATKNKLKIRPVQKAFIALDIRY